VPCIGVWSWQLNVGYLVIVAIHHSTNHNHESCIWQLWVVTICLFPHPLCHICRWSLVIFPSFLPPLPNHTCPLLQTHLNLLSQNPFRTIKIFHTQPGAKSLQKICHRHRIVQGSITRLFQTVLSPDYGQMLHFLEPSRPYFPPLVADTKVELPHPVGKLLQGEFRLLPADWGCAFGTAQVQQIIALIICIVFVIGNLL